MPSSLPHVEVERSDGATLTAFHPLRVMIVDDNHINLSVLSTLLKRRFSSLLDGPPVSVDSGLKAIQLLRTHVFDLILMDIQMPFLSGIDATLRIRHGEDGVLAANCNAHIVAVTTAVGDEPEVAYRRAGMDGMIGKPVRFQDMQHYLCPLSRQAHLAAASFGGEDIEVLPPLPPVLPATERIFYLPVNATVRAPRPDICKDADFESMLRSQTRASLRAGGALAIARSGTWSERPKARRTSSVDRSVGSRISEEDEDKVRAQDPPSSPTGSRLRMTINKRTLSQQIEREMLNMDHSDASDSEARKVRVHVKRPTVPHRLSSPAWLLEQSSVDEPASPLNKRPNWLLAMKETGSESAVTSSQSSSLQSSFDKDSLFDRRDSHQSNGSILSDVSTEITTPASELSTSPFEPSKLALQTRHLRTASSSSTETAVTKGLIHTSPIDAGASIDCSATKRGMPFSDVAVLAHTIREMHIEGL